jgi:hypothetical protein
MPELVHNINLSSVPHRPGQSTDLEAKRLRAWARLSDEEKEWVLVAWDLTGMIPSAPAFREMGNASDRVLYVLVGTEESLTPGELSYLMIARWFRNIDSATARAKMAQLVTQGLARYTGVGRTMAMETGLEKLEDMARPTRRDRDDSSSYRRDEPDSRYSRESGYRGGGDSQGNTPDSRRHRRDSDRDSRDSRGSRDSGDRRSNIGNYGAPKGPRRDDRGPRRDDRRPARDDRGPRRDDRGPRQDDRRGDSRGPREGQRRGGSDDPRRNERGPRIDGR